MDVAANLAALIHVARRVYQYGHDVVKAKEEQASMLASVQGILQLLQEIAKRETDARQNPKDAWYQGLLALCTSATTTPDGKALVPDPSQKGDGIFVGLKQAFKHLEVELEPKHGFAGVKQRWLWTHDKKKLKELIADIDHLRAHVDSVLQQDHFQLTRAVLDLAKDIHKTDINTNNQVHRLTATFQDISTKSSEVESRVQKGNVINDDTNARIKRLEATEARKERQEERRAIIEWLSPLQYRRRQSEIYNDAVFLGQSFLESNEYKAWREGRPWILYGYGLPGAGKTVLSSIIVSQLQTQFFPTKIPVLCVFLSHKEHRQTITNVLGSLLKQLIQLQGDDFRSTEVRRLFREATGEAAPTLDGLYTALEAEIATFERYDREAPVAVGIH